MISDDKVSATKIMGCVLGIGGIVTINIQPGVDFLKILPLEGTE